MTIDERAKTQEQRESNNVRPFIPRGAALRTKAGPLTSASPRSFPRGRNATDDDDDPGPSAA